MKKDILKTTICALGLMTSVASLWAQQAPAQPAPVAPPDNTLAQPAPVAPAGIPAADAPIQPAVIEPPVQLPPQPNPGDPAIPSVGADAAVASAGALPPSATRVFEFQNDEIGLVLRTLARASKVNMIISDKVGPAAGTVSTRLEDKTPFEAIQIIVNSKGLILDEQQGVFYIKTQEEKAKEPTEPGHYIFNYAKASDVAPLLTTQLQSGVAPQFDVRTNTIFFRESKSNTAKIFEFLREVDKPTKQVMIEARLVEVTANPQQAYGINWAGVVGSSANAQTIKYGGSTLAESTFQNITDAAGNVIGTRQVQTGGPKVEIQDGKFKANDFFLRGQGGHSFLDALGGQAAILSAPQMAITLRLLNEDKDSEFLANPRITTASNQKAEIKITRKQPVPRLNFNEQTGTAVFGGFEDKEFGNKLEVTPIVNHDGYVTLNVKPDISNKVGDATFAFSGATVTSPIIDSRSLDSNVLIRSGNTLAIGGLLQDELSKGRNKVPVAGDIPLLGYLFQERVNARQKRNLLIFITPTVIDHGQGTGLEPQAYGLENINPTKDVADPNGWRNNAKGVYRIKKFSKPEVPLASEYPIHTKAGKTTRPSR